MDAEPAPASAMAAAWLGKLPSTGDFASRRLDPAQVKSLDEWLSALMLALREREPQTWLADYLSSPSWRFLWMPQAMPPPWQGRAWVGVVIPSVDRVGRYFPLALIQPLAVLPSESAGIDAVWRWLQTLDEAAADALEGDWAIEVLEDQLASLGVPSIAAPPAADEPDEAPSMVPPADSPRSLEIDGHSNPGGLFRQEAFTLWSQARSDRCYWYCATEYFEPTLLESGGLADHALAQALFGHSHST